LTAHGDGALRRQQHRLPILVGTHHKAGHTDVWQLFAALNDTFPHHEVSGLCEVSSCVNVSMVAQEGAASAAQREVCLQYDINMQNWPWQEPLLFVQTIRDPVEMLLSAHVYHSTLEHPRPGAFFEGWARITMWQWHAYIGCAGKVATFPQLAKDAAARGMPNASYATYLRAVGIHTGLRAEFSHMMGYALGDMVELYEVAQASLRQRHFPLRFEDLQDNFGQTVSRLMHFMGMADSELQQGIDAAIAGRAKHRRSAMLHASDKVMKAEARIVLSHDRFLCTQLGKQQHRLGYATMECSPADHAPQ